MPGAPRGANNRKKKGEGEINRSAIVPVQLPRHVVDGLPLFYRALCTVMVRDGFVQLVSEDTQSDKKK